MDPKPLLAELEAFRGLLQATTHSRTDGGREISGIADSVALSDGTRRVFNEVAALEKQRFAKLPIESQANGVTVRTARIGEDCDARLVAAIDRVINAVGFPPESQSAGFADRWRCGDVITAQQIEYLDGAISLLRGASGPSLPASLDDEDILILANLVSAFPKRQIVRTIARAIRRDEKATRGRLNSLIEEGFACRPKGQRGGVVCTESGKQVMNSIEAAETR